MNGVRDLFGVLVLVALVGCGGTPSVSTSDARATAELAKQVRASPDRADKILADAGTTRAELEAKLYAIAKDPDASAAYAEALK